MADKDRPAVKKARQLSRAVIKTVAGMVVSSPNDLVRVAAHAGDNLLKGEFSKALADTYVYFINKGEIAPEYLNSRNFADLAPEFGVINKERFGIDKLNHLRKIFANLARDNGEDSHKKYLLDIALSMEEPEIKVLLADYELAINPAVRSNELSSHASSAIWRRDVAAISGLKHEALVGLYSEKLEEKMLIQHRTYSDKSGISWNERTSRLTDMGMELCELMTLNDDPIKEI